MGKKVYIDSQFVILEGKSATLVVSRTSVKDLIKKSVESWKNSLNKSSKMYELDLSLRIYEDYLEDSGRYKKSSASESAYKDAVKSFKENAKQYFSLEVDLYNQILFNRKQGNAPLGFELKNDSDLSHYLLVLLDLARRNNAKIDFRLSNEVDPTYVIFSNPEGSIFSRLKSAKEKIIDVFKLSDVKNISTKNGINFLISTKNGLLEFSTKKELLRHSPNFIITWAFVFILSVTILVAYSYRQHGPIENNDWISDLTSSCEKSFGGTLRTMVIGDLSFWTHTHTSMEGWISENRGNSENCYIDFGASSISANEKKLITCLAAYKVGYDFFNRCMPVVRKMCHIKGGVC